MRPFLPSADLPHAAQAPAQVDHLMRPELFAQAGAARCFEEPGHPFLRGDKGHLPARPGERCQVSRRHA